MMLFGLGVAAGIFLAAFYDLGRAFRKNVKHRNGAVAVEDGIFWLVTAGVLFGLLEKYNKGVLRFYVFLGCGVGICVYVLVLTRLFFPVFCSVLKAVFWMFGKLLLFWKKGKKIVKKLLILPLKNLWERIKIVRNNI